MQIQDGDDPNFPVTERGYLVPPAIVTPSMLSAAAVIAGFMVSWWALAAVPFIWLGALCSAPNLNMAQGCLAYLASIGGLALAAYVPPLGLSIASGTACGYVARFIEKAARMRPIPDDNRLDDA